MAREIGVSDSTITRHYNGDTKSLPHMSTIQKLVTRYHVSPPSGMGLDDTQGFAEPELTPLPLDDATPAEAPLSPDQHRWQVGRAMAGLSGYRPGDVILMDMAVKPQDGDDVVAQIEDMRGAAATVLRRYHRGWILGGADTEPEFVDAKRVRISGTVVKMWRNRDG